MPPAIAIVEDEYIVALDIRSFLERSGYRVVGLFPSGEELLAQMDDIAPELVLMDIKIRGAIDGVETAQRVHEQWRTPVILLTAYADEETIARAKISEPFGYILKPFEERELKTAIEIALYRAGMERKLRESEERYRRLFHDGISGNFLADVGGRVLEANASFRRILGLGPEDALPFLPELFPDTAGWESFKTGLAARRRVELAELSLKRPDGKQLLVLANAALVSDSDGNVSGFQGELSDVTERRWLEERLAQAQKMEAIGRLAGGMAHDFNNILTAILGYANLLSDAAPECPGIIEDIVGIRKAAAKATGLTRQLLAFSRRQPATPRAVDMDALVADTEPMLRRLLPEHVTLSYARVGGLPPVYVDPTQIEQMLVNLVVNARDAMPQGGRIAISTELCSFVAPLALGPDSIAPGTYLRLGVADSGSGMDEALLERIFEPFFTTKPPQQGTGLGLSTVYGIAKQAGGGVGVESSPGRGSTFSVYLPAMTEGADSFQVSQAPSPHEKESASTARRGTVLFVDDDEELRTLAERLLTRRGHRVCVAANAGEAILLAESLGPSLDVLVTDLVMPFMDGPNLVRRLRRMLPALAVVYMSGYPERIAEGVEGGRFLAKPFTEAELARAVDQSLCGA